MKIGILTFVGTQSHGACWQAYALKKAVERLGFDAEIINYHCASIDAVKTNKQPSNAKGLKKRVGAYLKYPIYRSRFGKFEKFERDVLKLGERVSAEQIENMYDRIIVGSDQIWNLELTGGDETYFLPQVHDRSKKLSYAASLGVDSFAPKDEARCIQMISDFTKICVREEELKAYLLSKMNEKVSCVIDPTQLLQRKDWDKIAGDKPRIPGKYMYVHAPNESPENWKAIYAIAKKKGLQIVYQTNRIYRKKDCRCLYSVSPEEYLNHIKFAEFVVTGSFHTLSFSLIFNRQFLCTDSMVKGRNSRIMNLLNTAGCAERMLMASPPDSLKPVEYSAVTKRLREKADESMNELTEMLR